MLPSAYALACWESSSCSSCLHWLLASSVATVSSPSCQNPRDNSLPVRKTERRVREALLNLPPYPPSVQVLLQVQSCFQSLLIQSEVSSPAEKAPLAWGKAVEFGWPRETQNRCPARGYPCEIVALS